MTRFAYYDDLNASQRATYRSSDEVIGFELELTPELTAAVAELRAALESERRPRVSLATNALCSLLTSALGIEPVTVQVLARRPTRQGDEYYGLYEREEGRRAQIQVWMRTAKQQRVVSFRTFLRTLLHELCHHFDFELLELEDTFHTEGFFKRESDLMRLLAPAKSEPSQTKLPKPPARPIAPTQRKPGQLSLFDE